MPVLLLLLVLLLLFLAGGVAKHAARRLDREGSHALLWRWLSAGGTGRQAGHQPRLDPSRHEGADPDRVRAPPLVPDPAGSTPRGGSSGPL